MRGSRRALRSPSGRRVFGDSAAGRDPGCEDWVGPWPCPRPGHSLGQPPVLWGPSGGVWMCASGGGVHNTPSHTQRHTRAHMRVQTRHTGTHKCVHTHVHTQKCRTYTRPRVHRNACTHACTHRRASAHAPLVRARTPREASRRRAAPCMSAPTPPRPGASIPRHANEVPETLREVARDTMCHVIR